MVGTHNIREFVSTHARWGGCSRDDLNICGRWKCFQQMVDTYVDADILYSDTKAAAALTVGEHVEDEVLKGNSVDDC